jgi:UDP-N-acetylmuramate dehydrogenase
MGKVQSPLVRHDWPLAIETLRARLHDSEVGGDAPLGALSTYRVGGRAAVLVDVGSRTDLEQFAALSAQAGWEVLVVGLGSNLLVADSGFDGIALRLGTAFANVSIRGAVVTAGGAAPLPVVARQCAAAGLGGFSWAVGVPGSIGGAVCMNAGGHGSDMRQVLDRVEIADLTKGGTWRATAHELAMGYRTSALDNYHVVVEVDLGLEPGDRRQEEQAIREIVAWRRRNQPGGANTGSVFKNPPGDAAGRLVELAGCKGLRVGTASISSRHANFIQADAGGSSSDVISLMREVARRVESHSGVRLHPETRLIGFDEPFRSET